MIKFSTETENIGTLNCGHKTRQFGFRDIMIPDFLYYRVFASASHNPLCFVIVINEHRSQKSSFVKSRCCLFQVDTGGKHPLDGLRHDH